MMTLKKLISILINIFENLLKIPALIYIIAYIVFIFIFAFTYTLMPNNSFYHSTAKYEKNELNTEASIVLEKLRNEIVNNFNSNYKSNTANINGWTVDSKNISVNSLNVKNYPDEVKFHLRYVLEFNGKHGKTVQYTGTNITLLFNNKMGTQDTISLLYQTSLKKEFPIKGLPKEPKISSIITKNPNTFVSSPEYLSISIGLYNEMLNFGKAYLGFPSEIRNHFPRMLYFSASLATSNGLGDIVPITNGARLLVTIESILMLIIIALFLSSLAEKLVSQKE